VLLRLPLAEIARPLRAVSCPDDSAPRRHVGPTGAGKTRLSLELAERAGGEVISCDSQQVYVGMDIGTGKVSAGERARVPHHGIDIIAPDQDMTAARFVELADRAIADCAARGKPAIVCGGTGLYVRALLLGLFEGPRRRRSCAPSSASSTPSSSTRSWSESIRWPPARSIARTPSG